MLTLNRVIMIIAWLALLIVKVSYATNTPQKLTVTPKGFKDPVTFNISLPSGYQKNKAKSYPMMFDFHPKANTYLKGMHDWMSHNGEWPWLETIIVTPAPGNRVGVLFDSSGQTTPLLDFFDEQLFPLIDKKFRTNGFRIMSGFRVNGTIVLSSLINKPHLANAYIAVSPELKNDFAGVLSTIRKKLNKSDSKPRFLLLSHGTNVKEDHQYALYSQLKGALVQAAPTSLDWHYKHFTDNYFMSLPLLSVILGIEKLFDDIHRGLSPSSAIAQQGVAAIISHYQYLSKAKYGFDVSPKKSLNNLGFYLLKTSESKGLSVFTSIVEMYPNDAYSHHNLARAYAEIGQFTQAVAYQKKAVNYAKNMAGWHQKRHQRFLEKYTEALSHSK